MANRMANCAVLALLALVCLPACLAETGDTFTASLSNDTVPVTGSTVKLVKGAGSAVMTLNDFGKGIYLWECDVYDLTSPIKEIKIVDGGNPALPTVFSFATVDQPDDNVYYGNITRDQLEAGLDAAGVAEGMAALFDGSLLAVVELQKPAGAALVGKLDAYPVDGSFSDIGAAAPNTEDYSESISDDVTNIYLAQLYNSTVHYFRTGMIDSEGTGSLLIFDYDNGTYDWDLTLDLIPNPASAQLRLFKTLYDQPVILDLVPYDAFAPELSSYTGRFTQEELNFGLNATGGYDYIPDGVPSIFNVTPPVVFATAYNTDNQTTLGFVFDADAAPAEKPVLKDSNAALSRSSGWLGLGAAAAAALLLLL